MQKLHLQLLLLLGRQLKLRQDDVLLLLLMVLVVMMMRVRWERLIHDTLQMRILLLLLLQK